MIPDRFLIDPASAFLIGRPRCRPTAVIFGLAHASNLIGKEAKAFLQVLATAIAGYFFYLIRRSWGGLLVPAVVHELWDFGLITGFVVPTRGFWARPCFFLADVVLLMVLVWRRGPVSER
jgi:CAAX protease family protein